MSTEVLFFGDLLNDYKILGVNYPCLIDYKDMGFKSVFHLFLYMRHEFDENEELKEKIKEVKHVSELKLLPKSEQNDSDLLLEDMLNMTEALEMRVAQDETAKRALLESKNRNLLYVANSDLLSNDFWASKYNSKGLDMYKDGDDEFLEGQNLYGKSLQMIRKKVKESLIKNRDEHGVLIQE